MLLALAEHFTIEHIVSGGSPNLYLIEDTAALIKIAAATDMLRNIKPVLPDQPPIRSTFDIYHSADLLIYHKEPCRAEDVQEHFFLHIYPAETGDLPPPPPAARLRSPRLRLPRLQPSAARGLRRPARATRLPHPPHQHRPVRASGKQLQPPLGGGVPLYAPKRGTTAITAERHSFLVSAALRMTGAIRAAQYAGREW